MEANFVAMFEGKWAEKVEITDKLFWHNYILQQRVHYMHSQEHMWLTNINDKNVRAFTLMAQYGHK